MMIMRSLVCFLAMAMLAGCATTKSGVEKSYDVNISLDNGSTAEFFMGVEADTQAETTSGDAGATSSVDPAVALGMQGSTTSAAAKGAEQVLKDIISYAEQWMKKDADNVDNSDNSQGGEAPVLAPVPIEKPVTDVYNLGDYQIIARAECDKEMYYTHAGESSGTKQKRCVFDKPGVEYGETFIIQWSSGETLEVMDSSSMAWDTSDFRKYQPVDPEDGSGNAGVYAGRGDNSTYAQLLGKP